MKKYLYSSREIYQRFYAEERILLMLLSLSGSLSYAPIGVLLFFSFKFCLENSFVPFLLGVAVGYVSCRFYKILIPFYILLLILFPQGSYVFERSLKRQLKAELDKIPSEFKIDSNSVDDENINPLRVTRDRLIATLAATAIYRKSYSYKRPRDDAPPYTGGFNHVKTVKIYFLK